MVYPWINPFAGGPSSSVQPWLVSALCAALLLALRSWRLPSFPMALWIAFAAVATALRALPALEAMTVIGALFVIVSCAGTVATQSRDDFVAAIATAWLAAACLNAVFALLQYFGANDALVPWVSGSTIGEAYGNLRQRNQLASLMAIGLASLAWFVGRGMSVRVALVPVALLAAGSAASASRTGAVQWVVLLALMFAWHAPRRREIVTVGVVGLAVYAAMSALLPMILSHVAGVSGASVFARFVGESGCFSRRVLWSNVIHLIAQHPWLGWGWGELDWAHFMTLYPGERFCDILDNAHSLPLHLAVELGVPVAIVACGGLVWALARTAPWREADASRQLALAVVAVILIHSLLEYPLWYGPFQIALGLSLGMLWPAKDEGPASPFLANACGGVAALAMAALAYAGWDYHRISQIYMSPEARDERFQGDPMPELRKSWLFSAQVQFAELSITPLSRANAQWTYDRATEMLHYSPEPKVIEKVIESATMLGKDDVAIEQLARFRAAFPKEHSEWVRQQASPRASVD